MGCVVAIVIFILISIVGGFLSSSDIPATATEPPPRSEIQVKTVAKMNILEDYQTNPNNNSIAPVKLDWNVQVINWHKIGKKLCWSNDNNCENAKGSWYLVKIGVENQSKTKGSLSSMNFRLHDSNNRRYKHYENLVITKLYADYTYETEIDNAIIYPSIKKEFVLLFDIPENSNNLQLEFMPNVREKSTEFSLDENNEIIGDPVGERQCKLDIINIENKGKELEWSNFEDKKIAYGKWLIVTVNVKNLTNKDIALNPINFRILSKKNDTYEHYQNLAIAENYGVYRKGQAILNNILEPNKQSTYYLVYDLPLEAEAEYLEFIPQVKQKGVLFDLKPKDLIENKA